MSASIFIISQCRRLLYDFMWFFALQILRSIFTSFLFYRFLIYASNIFSLWRRCSNNMELGNPPRPKVLTRKWIEIRKYLYLNAFACCNLLNATECEYNYENGTYGQHKFHGTKRRQKCKRYWQYRSLNANVTVSESVKKTKALQNNLAYIVIVGWYFFFVREGSARVEQKPPKKTNPTIITTSKTLTGNQTHIKCWHKNTVKQELATLWRWKWKRCSSIF